VDGNVADSSGMLRGGVHNNGGASMTPATSYSRQQGHLARLVLKACACNQQRGRRDAYSRHVVVSASLRLEPGGGVYNAGSAEFLASDALGNLSPPRGISECRHTPYQWLAHLLNRAFGAQARIYNDYPNSALDISSTWIAENTAWMYGGGIYNYTYGTLVMRDSTVSGNVVSHISGAGICNWTMPPRRWSTRPLRAIQRRRARAASGQSGNAEPHQRHPVRQLRKSPRRRHIERRSPQFANTIIAQNTSGSDADVEGMFSSNSDHNLVGVLTPSQAHRPARTRSLAARRVPWAREWNIHRHQRVGVCPLLPESPESMPATAIWL